MDSHDLTTKHDVYRRTLIRLTKIHRAIGGNRYPTVASLSAELGVSVRTIKRDLSMLKEELTAPLLYDRKKKGFYYARPGWDIPLQRITEGDLLAFFIAQHALTFTGQNAFAAQLGVTLAKLGAMFPQELAVDLAALGENASFEDQPKVACDPHLLQRLAKASISQVTVEFDYLAARNGTLRRRKADIHLLHNYAGDWYAVSWDHGAKDFRDFHVGRISNLVEGERAFDKQKGWRREEYLSSGFSMTRGGRMTNVSIVFDKYQARWMRERGSFHPNESREDLHDGGLRISFKVGTNGLDAVARFCLTYAGHCVAESPKQLREMIKKRAAKAVEDH